MLKKGYKNMDEEDIPIYPFGLDDFERFSFESDDLFYRRSIIMIEYAHKNGLEIVTLFKIIVDSEELYLNLPKDVWVNTLEKAITHFELVEAYEMCVEAQKVLDLIS